MPPCSKNRVSSRASRASTKRRYFVQRDPDPVGTSETAVDFPVHVEHGVALRHVVDLLQVVGLGPDRIEQENREDRHDRQGENRELPREPKFAWALFSGRRTGEKLHR